MSFYYVADPSKRKHKIALKYIFVYGTTSCRKTMSQMALLTDDNRYIEYELNFRSHVMTTWVAGRIRSLFGSYQISSKTEVVFSRDIDTASPMYLYMMFLQQQMQFNLRTVTVETVLRGIAAYHQSYLKVKGKHITNRHTNDLWRKIVKNKVCHWIDEKYDNAISKVDLYKQRDKKRLRLGMYYLVIKNYRDSIIRRYFERRKLKQQSQQAELLSTAASADGTI